MGKPVTISGIGGHLRRNAQYSLHGRVLPSRPGLRAGDQALNLYFSVLPASSGGGSTLTR